MLALEKVSTFAVFSTTFFAYVLVAIMTHFSDRLFATQPYLNDIKRILAHYTVRSDVLNCIYRSLCLFYRSTYQCIIFSS